VPAALQTLPPAVQSVQLAPHLVSVLQVTQAVPLQYWPALHEPLTPPAVEQTQPTLAPPQVGVVPAQATQEGPQWAVTAQLAQLAPLHHSAPSQSPLSAHSTQSPAAQTGVAPPQTSQETPQWSGSSRPQVVQVPASHHS